MYLHISWCLSYYIINPKQYVWNVMSFTNVSHIIFYDIYKSSELFSKDFYTILKLTFHASILFPSFFLFDFKIKYCDLREQGTV